MIPGMAFDHRGFYLHASWQYEYPFAVRTWTLKDYTHMFQLLHDLGMDRVMIWPMTEIAPPPLSPVDREHFNAFREVVAAAQAQGLECWLTFAPCVSSTEAIRAVPFGDRVFYPNKRTLRLDDPVQRDAYMAHLGDLFQCLNNADGYVFIDGDPGGYPGAHPDAYVHMLSGARSILDRVCTGHRPKLIPWVWCGWGSDWDTEGVWKPDLRRLVEPFLKALKAHSPTEPWELLPGRSFCDGHANGRINFELIEEADLLERSTLMTYEIIEFEPTPPAFVLQFDDIRRVLREEGRHASVVRGVMGNAQQPITAFHNLFYFARCTESPDWLDKTDEQVLIALAEFLGGDANLLVPAWSIAHTPLDQIPPGLVERLRKSTLQAKRATWLPGGAEQYLDILALFAESRISVLQYTLPLPRMDVEAEDAWVAAAATVIKWWSRHRYVGDGNSGQDFKWAHTHPALLTPLVEWMKKITRSLDEGFEERIVDSLAAMEIISRENVALAVHELLKY